VNAPEPQVFQVELDVVARPEPQPGPEAEEELDLAAEMEADWGHEWDSADSAAYQARVEAGLEPEAGS
jgi:hypothetical protein